MLPPKIPYWIQRADFGSREYPPARFKRGLAALRRHDWAAELKHEEQLAEAGQETCMPGIGFVYAKGCVLHICPYAYGSAACFFIDNERSLDLTYADPQQQRRLMRLLYRGRRQRLVKLFESNLKEPAWAGALREALIAAKVLAAIAAGFVLLIAAVVFATDVADGKSAGASLARILENLPFVLSMQAMMVAVVVPVVGLILLAMGLVKWAGYTFQIEGRDHTANLAIGTVMILLMTALAVWTGKWDNLPIAIASIVCFFGMFMWPLVVMGGLRRQQNRLLEKIRAQYVIATTLLMEGAEQQARERLTIIRKLEAHWHLGARPTVRYAHIAYAWVTTFYIAFPGQVFHYHLNSLQNPLSLGDTVRFMLETPSVLVIAVGIALFFSLIALPDAIRVDGRAWSEFYGDNLQAALKAGRGVERAEHHDAPPLPAGVSARELLGLSPGFTKAQLRAAWLRLARELHPDKWSAAGPAVRKMKEAALQRVNAARDELAPLAL